METKGKKTESGRYNIGGSMYTQHEMKLYQMIQLSHCLPLDQMKLGEIKIETPKDLVDLLGDAVSKALAIILCPAGVDLRKKNISKVQLHLEDHLNASILIEVLEDFFVCNQVSSVAEKVTAIVILVMKLWQQPSPTPSKSGSASSPTETSQNET